MTFASTHEDSTSAYASKGQPCSDVAPGSKATGFDPAEDGKACRAADDSKDLSHKPTEYDAECAESSAGMLYDALSPHLDTIKV
jgi:hypothetical protein